MAEDERTRRFRAERTEQLKRRPAIIRDTQAEIFRLLGVAQETIQTRLANAPSEWEQFYLPQLQSQVTAAMTVFRDGASQTTVWAAGTAWAAGIDMVDAPIGAGGVTISQYLPVLNTQTLVAFQSFQTTLINDISTTIANRINQELALVAIGSQGQSDAISAIERHIDTGGRSRATTILRTELGRVYSTATQRRLMQAAERLPGLQKEWRRSGKVHSRARHDATNGQRVPVNEKFRIAYSGARLMYPRDPNGSAKETINCGCESLPWMESWDVAQ